jgi:hypothetical protein
MLSFTKTLALQQRRCIMLFFKKKIVPLLSGVCTIVWSMVKLNASSTSTFTSLGYAVREFPN